MKVTAIKCLKTWSNESDGNKALRNPPKKPMLNAVYDALDAQNYPRAIKLATNAAKVLRDADCANALKAYALARSGNKTEALLVAALLPINEVTIQPLKMAYIALRLYDRVADLCQAIHSTYPQSEEFATNWILAVVRIGDFKRIQQAALAVYKTLKIQKYQMWILVAIV